MDGHAINICHASLRFQCHRSPLSFERYPWSNGVFVGVRHGHILAPRDIYLLQRTRTKQPTSATRPSMKRGVCFFVFFFEASSVDKAAKSNPFAKIGIDQIQIYLHYWYIPSFWYESKMKAPSVPSFWWKIEKPKNCVTDSIQKALLQMPSKIAIFHHGNKEDSNLWFIWLGDSVLLAKRNIRLNTCLKTLGTPNVSSWSTFVKQLVGF